MLEFQNVTVQYGAHPPVLHHLSLSLKKGDILCLVGESGSGKSTVLNAALGLLPGKGRVTGGDILLDGLSVLSLNEKELNQIRGKRIASVPQDTGITLDPIMTVGKQFTEYICTHEKTDSKTAAALARKMLAAVRLLDPENIMDSYPYQLSGGMRQRVGIAMALVFHPEFLLADEPTSALDVTTQAQIVRQIQELRENFDAGILMITHNLALAAYISDNIYVLKDGKVADHGTREDILHHPRSSYTKMLLQSVPGIGGDCYV